MPVRVWFPMAARNAVHVPAELTFLGPDYRRLRDGEDYIRRWLGGSEDPKQRNRETAREKRQFERIRRRNEEIWPPSESPFPQLPFRCLTREELLWADRNRSDTQLWEPMHRFLEDICELELPATSELESLAAEASKGDNEKRVQLIASCMRYVLSYFIRSENYVPPIQDDRWLDAIELGYEALTDAVKTYQPGHGITFETYMSACIYYAAMDVSGDVIDSYFMFCDALWLREYRMTFRALSMQMGRDPSALEALQTMILWMDEEGFDPYGLSNLDAVRCFLYDRERPENHSGAASLKDACPCTEKGGCDGI